MSGLWRTTRYWALAGGNGPYGPGRRGNFLPENLFTVFPSRFTGAVRLSPHFQRFSGAGEAPSRWLPEMRAAHFFRPSNQVFVPNNENGAHPPWSANEKGSTNSTAGAPAALNALNATSEFAFSTSRSPAQW